MLYVVISNYQNIIDAFYEIKTLKITLARFPDGLGTVFWPVLVRGGGFNRAGVTTGRCGGVWSYNYCHTRPAQRLMNTLRHRGSAVSHAGITCWTANRDRVVSSAGSEQLTRDSWQTGDRRVRTVTLERLRLPISGKNSRVICYRRATAHYTSSCQICNLKPLFRNKYCVYWRVYWFYLYLGLERTVYNNQFNLWSKIPR